MHHSVSSHEYSCLWWHCAIWLWPQSWSRAGSQWSSHESGQNDVILHELLSPRTYCKGQWMLTACKNVCIKFETTIFQVFFHVPLGNYNISDPIYTLSLSRCTSHINARCKWDLRLEVPQYVIMHTVLKLCFLSVQLKVCTGQAVTWQDRLNSKCAGISPLPQTHSLPTVPPTPPPPFPVVSQVEE